MKKTIFVLLALFFIAVGSFVFIHNWMKGLSNDITITETTRFGDREMADGLQVISYYRMDYDMPNWGVQYDFTSRKVIDWSQEEEKDIVNRDDADIFLYPADVWDQSIDAGCDSLSQCAETIEEQTGILADDLLAAVESAEKGKRTKEIFYFKDYIERLPVMLIMSGIDLRLDLKLNRTKFDIPVPKGAKLVLEIKKDEKGEVTWWEIYTDFEPLYIESDGTIDGNWIYLAATGIGIEGNNEESEITYTEHILDAGEDSHGIHKIPFNYGGHQAWADLDKAELAYPLKKGEQVIYLTKSYNERNLLLFTRKNRNLYLSVIEKETMDCSQKTLLMKDTGEFFGTIQKDNFLLYLDNQQQFAVIDMSEEVYRLHLTGILEFCPDSMNELDAAFDGKRFALVYYPRYTEDDSDYAKPVYQTWVYGEKNIVYHGEFSCSLAERDNLNVDVPSNGKPIEIMFSLPSAASQ